MIYYTGDIHGDPYEVIQFCDSKKLTEQDIDKHIDRMHFLFHSVEAAPQLLTGGDTL